MFLPSNNDRNNGKCHPGKDFNIYFIYRTLRSADYGTFLRLFALRRGDFDGIGPIRARVNLRGRLRSVLQPHRDQLHHFGRRASGVFGPDFGMTINWTPIADSTCPATRLIRS